MSLELSFRYEIGGSLKPIEDPCENAPEGEDLAKSLARLGFSHMGTLGDENGLSMEIHASQRDDHHWLLVASDSFSYCLIEVLGWPTYLDALARYSPIYSRPIV